MPLIHLKTKRVEYKFDIFGKYTVIQGDSGCGKTTFYGLVDAMFSDNTACQNISGQVLVPVGKSSSINILQEYTRAIFVLDENCALFKDHQLAAHLKKSDNYFIFINRDEKTLDYLPLSVDSIFEMKTSGKFHTISQRHKRHIIESVQSLDAIITEDSRSGHLFFKDMLANVDSVVIRSAGGMYDAKHLCKNTGGAAKIVGAVLSMVDAGFKSIVVVYDACGFGAQINSFEYAIRALHANIMILDWDSFEGYILASPMYNKHVSLKDMDCSVNNFEEFLTERLSAVITGYSKDKLPYCLRRARCQSCRNGTACKYRAHGYENLIYGGVEKIYNYVSERIEGNKVYETCEESSIF